MALPILDGNQTSTTLATTVSGGAHYPNHIIASGTVTANGFDLNNTSYDPIPLAPFDEPTAGGKAVVAKIIDDNGSGLNLSMGVPISGTVTANVFGFNSQGLIKALPIAEAGDDQAEIGIPVVANIGGGPQVIGDNYPLPISGTVTANLDPIILGGASNVQNNYAVQIGFYDNIDNRNKIVSNGNDVNSGLVALPVTQINPISGTVTASISNSVTIASLPSITGTVTANNPSGALTTRFGSVTTANTAQLTAAVTNNARKYLLAQNISAGTVTIGIGFSPTTTQGIQLTAGAGITFDSFCPTGAVYWLGATTGATFTILEG